VYVRSAVERQLEIVWDTIVPDVPRLLHDIAKMLGDAPPLTGRLPKEE